MVSDDGMLYHKVPAEWAMPRCTFSSATGLPDAKFVSFDHVTVHTCCGMAHEAFVPCGRVSRHAAKSACLKKWWARPSWTQNLGSHGGWWTKAAKVDLICMGLAAGPRWSRDGIRWRHAVPQGPSRVSWAAKVYLFLCHGSTRCEVCEFWSRHCTHVLRHGPCVPCGRVSRHAAKSACLKKWWARPSWTQNLGSHGGWWTKAAKVDLICMGLAAGPRWSRDGIRWRHAVPQGPSRVSWAAKVYLFLCHGSTRCEVCEFWSRHCTHVLRHGPWGICSLWTCFAPCRQVRLLEKVMSPPQLNSEFGQSWRLMDQSRESRFNLHGSGCRSQVVPRWYPMTACCATRSQQSELSCQGVPFPLPRVYQMRSLWVLITSLYTRVAAWPMRHLFLVDVFRAMPPSPLAWKSDEPATRGTLSAIL